MMIKIKGMVKKYKGNENLARGKRMLLIRQREWNKQKGNDKETEREREYSAYNSQRP